MSLSETESTVTKTPTLLITRCDGPNVPTAPTGWTVSITLDDVLVKTDVPLPDPFDESQNSDLSWYLEQYPVKSPFEVGRAAAAAEAFSTYGQLLIEQLGL
jgi:hypothetical protein